VGGRDYPRDTVLPGIHVDIGDVLTFVSLHSPKDAEAAEVGQYTPDRVVRMHDAFFGLTIRDDGRATYDFMKGGPDPEDSWYHPMGGYEFSELLIAGGSNSMPERVPRQPGLVTTYYDFLTFAELIVPGSGHYLMLALVLSFVWCFYCIAAKLINCIGVMFAAKKEEAPAKDLV